MNKFLELITVPIATNGQSRFELSGDYFEIIDSAYPVTVLLEDRNGAQIGRMSGAEASYFLRDTPFKAITITSAQAQTVRIAFGNGEAGNRRTAGVVQVVDGGKARTLAGVSYMAKAFWGGTGGNFSHAQLWNVSTNRSIVIKSAQFFGGSGFDLYHAPTQLANASNFAASKLIGAGNSIASRTYTQSKATNDVNIDGSKVILNSGIEPSGTYQWKFEEPLVIPPNKGITASSNVLGEGIGIIFELVEEPI